jgi:hypothetical protein
MANDYGLIVTNLTPTTAATKGGISTDQIMKINNSMNPTDFVIRFLHHESIYLSYRLIWGHNWYSTYHSFATRVSQLKKL